MMPELKLGLEGSPAVELTKHNTAKAISKLRHLFGWAIYEKSLGRTVQVYALTGFSDPEIWNYLEPHFHEILRKEVQYEHLFGPALATLDGESRLIDMFERYRKTMRCKLLRNREPNHWVIAGSSGKSNDLRFRLLVEEAHPLISRTFKMGELTLLSEDDKYKTEKREVYEKKLAELCALHEKSEEVTDMGDLETVEYLELKRACKINPQKMPSSTLDAHELWNFLHSS